MVEYKNMTEKQLRRWDLLANITMCATVALTACLLYGIALDRKWESFILNNRVKILTNNVVYVEIVNSN